MVHSLYITRCRIGSQCKSSRNVAVMWSYLRFRMTRRAAAFRTDCRAWVQQTVANLLFSHRDHVAVCMPGGLLQCVVMYIEFYINRFSSFAAVGGRKSPFPITLAIGLYDSLYYRTSQSVSGTLNRPRVVAPSKTCDHVRSSRRR